MSTHRTDDGLSDPPRGSYRVLAKVHGTETRCIMDGAYDTETEARTAANIAATQFDVKGTEIIFDAYTNPDEEF